MGYITKVDEYLLSNMDSIISFLDGNISSHGPHPTVEHHGDYVLINIRPHVIAEGGCLRPGIGPGATYCIENSVWDETVRKYRENA